MPPRDFADTAAAMSSQTFQDRIEACAFTRATVTIRWAFKPLYGDSPSVPKIIASAPVRCSGQANCGVQLGTPPCPQRSS